MPATRYPIVLVHGIGLRGPVYWGRIPAILAGQRATVYITRQDAVGTLQHNARQLHHQIHVILQYSGAQKVNIIAHSKGGLEARCLAATRFGRRHIASITTVGTPHGGSRTAQAILAGRPQFSSAICKAADALYRLSGDQAPDLRAALAQLTDGPVRALNRALPRPRHIYCQSYGSCMGRPGADVFMALPYSLVRRFDGENDGLVGTHAVRWANFRALWWHASHLDTMDLLRRPSRYSALHRWYTGILGDLQQRGL